MPLLKPPSYAADKIFKGLTGKYKFEIDSNTPKNTISNTLLLNITGINWKTRPIL